MAITKRNNHTTTRPVDGESAEEIKKAAELARNAPYKWLTDVENKLIYAFIDDQTLLQRVRTKIACRGIPGAPVRITMPPNRKGQLNVANLGDSVNYFAKIADRPLSAEEEESALARFEWCKANRDLLAHRMGRESSTLRWKACPSDEYGSPLKIYQRRLADAGKFLAGMGVLPEPEHHRWKSKPKAATVGRSDEQREADAQRNATAMVGP